MSEEARIQKWTYEHLPYGWDRALMPPELGVFTEFPTNLCLLFASPTLNDVDGLQDARGWW